MRPPDPEKAAPRYRSTSGPAKTLGATRQVSERAILTRLIKAAGSPRIAALSLPFPYPRRRVKRNIASASVIPRSHCNLRSESARARILTTYSRIHSPAFISAYLHFPLWKRCAIRFRPGLRGLRARLQHWLLFMAERYTSCNRNNILSAYMGGNICILSRIFILPPALLISSITDVNRTKTTEV